MALAAVPDSLASAEAGPLLCAGITTFNALRNSGAKPPDVVAVLGLGGLGHLGVQYAAKMGFTTVAIARGADKAKFAHELGAHYYIDNTAEDVAAELQKLGGARTILATVTDAGAMSAVDRRAGPSGQAGDSGCAGRTAAGSGYSADPAEAGGGRMAERDVDRFGRHAEVQRPLRREGADREVSAGQGARGIRRMMSGKARFRVVLETGA